MKLHPARKSPETAQLEPNTGLRLGFQPHPVKEIHESGHGQKQGAPGQAPAIPEKQKFAGNSEAL
jgi:hypothetical protein